LQSLQGDPWYAKCRGSAFSLPANMYATATKPITAILKYLLKGHQQLSHMTNESGGSDRALVLIVPWICLASSQPERATCPAYLGQSRGGVQWLFDIQQATATSSYFGVMTLMHPVCMDSKSSSWVSRDDSIVMGYPTPLSFSRSNRWRNTAVEAYVYIQSLLP
jgi:hypothetical protein